MYGFHNPQKLRNKGTKDPDGEEEEEELQGVTRSYKENANSNRPIGPYKAVRYLT